MDIIKYMNSPRFIWLCRAGHKQSKIHPGRQEWDLLKKIEHNEYLRVRPQISGGMDGALEIISGEASRKRRIAREIALHKAGQARKAITSIFKGELDGY